MAYSDEEKTLECIFCPAVNKYVTLANSFSQDLSATLSTPIIAIFGALVGVWLSIAGIRIILGSMDSRKFALEGAYIIIAAGLLSSQGTQMANTIYAASLSTMAGASAMVLTTGPLGKQIKDANVSVSSSADTSGSQIANLDGLGMLVYTAENGVFGLFSMAGAIWDQGGFTNPLPLVAATMMVLPYALLMVAYAAQVLICVFRVLMISLFSPMLVAALGFDFLRAMTWSGLRALLASFMVLFASTAALAVCLYGVATLGIGKAEPTSAVAPLAEFDSVGLWLVIILGWCGMAFQSEGVGLANSITGAQLTNTAAGILTAGATATGLGFLKFGQKRAFQIAGNVAPFAQQGIDMLRGKPSAGGGGGNSGGSSLRDRVNTPGIDKGS
ncbi:hypothetical protein [Novispirillum itersonii]|uniref:Type IV secretion system protein TrbL n=1 Tax=Novispirillum itersonii TaxID=189 RepID=A0A7X0DNA7_NOVIT|nr:hypothetical protein [Novispirillum itersonii]MBB6211800.1 type IV secretion system protein TrbL [Novispirillum itersonii]